jgi:hypothetical protein
MSKDYLDKNSKCSNHSMIDAVYYNWNNKWLCKECLQKEFEKLKENKK